MSSGSKTKVVEKSQSGPWAPAVPFLTDIMSQARSLHQQSQNDTYYPFSTSVPFSNQTEDALGMIETRARNGSSLIDTASEQVEKMMAGTYGNSPFANYLTGTAQGANLNGNPWLDSMFNQAADKITNRVNRTAGLRGRAGSGAHQQLLQSRLGNLANDIYAQNYQQERTRQIEAISDLQDAWENDYSRRAGAVKAAEGLAMTPYLDAGALQAVGNQREILAKGQLDDLQGRHIFEQDDPWKKLLLYAQSLNGMGGQGGTNYGTRTTTVKNQMSPFDIFSSAIGII